MLTQIACSLRRAGKGQRPLQRTGEGQRLSRTFMKVSTLPQGIMCVCAYVCLMYLCMYLEWLCMGGKGFGVGVLG